MRERALRERAKGRQARRRRLALRATLAMLVFGGTVAEAYGDDHGQTSHPTLSSTIHTLMSSMDTHLEPGAPLAVPVAAVPTAPAPPVIPAPEPAAAPPPPPPPAPVAVAAAPPPAKLKKEPAPRRGRAGPATPGPDGKIWVEQGPDRHELMPASQIGVIEIPKIGLVHAVFEGWDLPQLHWGPGHWAPSPKPGQKGNTVFGGHRVSHTRPFFDIDRLEPGDTITFKMPDGTFNYTVTEHFVVGPLDTWIVKPVGETTTATLFACHPKQSADQRYVVRATLTGAWPAAA